MDNLVSYRVDKQSPAYPMWALEVLQTIHNRLELNKRTPGWIVMDHYFPIVTEISTDLKPHYNRPSIPLTRDTLRECNDLTNKIIRQMREYTK